MKRFRVFALALIAAALVIVAAGFFLFAGLSDDRVSSGSEEENPSFVNLGLTYMPVTPGLSTYYNLGVDFGALVTEVTLNSIADKAGVQVGDVILSFNGAQVNEEIPLLGMMMSCPAGDSVTLEVWKGQNNRVTGLSCIEIKESNQ